jgi:hypothetical protein
MLSDCGAEARYSDWSNQKNSRSDQLVCPRPRRSFNGRSQFNFNSCGSFRAQDVDVDLDMLAIIAMENESDDDLELGTDNDDSYFFCGSPPLRSDNPLSHDPEFRYMGDFYGTMKCSSSSIPKRSPQSLSPAPVRRIEGFTCGNSNHSNSGANRVIRALA